MGGGTFQNALNLGGNILTDAIGAVKDVLVAQQGAKGQVQTAQQLATAEATRQSGQAQIAVTVVVGALAMVALFFMLRDE